MESFLKKNGLNSNERKTMLEAYRRKFMFHGGTTLESAWLGLGTKKQYGNRLFKAHNGRLVSDRERTWWVLSNEGVSMFLLLSEKYPLPTDANDKNALNNRFFGLPDGVK